MSDRMFKRQRGRWIVWRITGRWDGADYQGWHIRCGRAHVVWKPWHRRAAFTGSHFSFEVRL